MVKKKEAGYIRGVMDHLHRETKVRQDAVGPDDQQEAAWWFYTHP